MGAIARKALAVVIPRFALLHTSNIHGAPHWARVARNGKILAGALNVNPAITEWFAFLHDSCRLNDDDDPDHGPRAAEFATTLRSTLITELDVVEFRQLLQALDGHSYGYVKGFPNAVRACWDADRLDLPRVGIRPDPQRMSTKPGAEMARALRIEEKTLRPRGKSVYHLLTSWMN